MRKITLLLFSILATCVVKAQDTCDTAIAVSTGVTTVGEINGSEVPQPVCTPNGDVPIGSGPAGEWYTFTPAEDGVYSISSDLVQNIGGDTRFHIYTGTCNDLVCAGGNDDTAANFLSLAYINATAGTTYYIAWDNRWSADGFDFEIALESDLNCADIVDFPYSQDWNDTTNPSGDSSFKWNTCWTEENFGADAGWTFNGANDFDGDGIDDNVINVFPQEDAPVPAKDAWTISSGIAMNSNSAYDITVEYNGVDVGFIANESFELVILNEQASNAPSQTVVGSFSDITMQGTFAGPPNLFEAAYSNTVSYTPTEDGVYHLGIHATSAAGGGVLFIKEVSIEERTLSVNEFDTDNFNYFVDVQNYLNLSAANQSFEKVTLFNLLGQQVLNQNLSSQNEQIDLNALTSGVYLANVQINGEAKTFKIMKK